jgi:hypothetical protein
LPIGEENDFKGIGFSENEAIVWHDDTQATLML